MRQILVLVFLCFALNLCAQLHDNTWFVGYGGEPPSTPTDSFGISVLTFPDNRLRIGANTRITMSLDFTNACFSDSAGQLLVYSNGIYFENKFFKKIVNGLIIDGPDWELGYRSPQGGLLLGHPKGQGLVDYFQATYAYLDDVLFLEGDALFHTTLDMKANNGNGKVLAKKVPLRMDTLQAGKLTAAKHANGRDWWIPLNESHSNIYHFFLYDPQGVRLHHTQRVGTVVHDGLGQAVFTPDGSKYIKLNIASNFNDVRIDIYDFDRCTGTFSNQRHIPYEYIPGSGGVAVSKNSRFLYLSAHTYMWQYDLWAADIAASRQLIAIYDGFLGPFRTRFSIAQLAPDGKIYIAAPSGVLYLHVIHEPDLPYPQCMVEQHAVETPTYIALGLPNCPNYRLGPLDGSPCDTLGLDNLPLSRFRYRADTLDSLSVAFRDLSDYEPAEWLWDFGDGQTSRDTNPEHHFAKASRYEVCLTVKNRNGQHSSCQTLYLGVSAQDNPVLQAQIQVSPNPFSEQLAVALSAPELRGAVFRLFDATGRLVREMGLEYGINEVEASDLGKGLYFWAVEKKGERVKSGKVVKI